jgi:branched-subunit amino acid aminotransferase/4-amino-4-deoxychorismate lyase
MSAGYIQANTGGRLHAAAEPSISPLNRGFLYGDAIYEVWRTYGGVIFAWDEHWRRFNDSALALHMKVEFSKADILGEIRRTAAAFRERSGGRGELYIRFQVARGSGPIGLDTALADRAEFVILVQDCPELTAEKAAAGLRLSIATSLRRNPVQSLDPAWKTGNYLNNLLCLREARARGADDVVILNMAGEVAEASVANIAFARGSSIVTPPLGAGILSGITRGLVLGGIARDAGLAVEERAVRPEELSAMDECFLLSTTKDIVPVRSVDSYAFRVGGGAGARLKGQFALAAQRYAAAHPELAL